jgi:hypothetical protein
MALAKKNQYGEEPLKLAQAQKVTEQVNAFNKVLEQGKYFQTAEELAKPLIDKPYRYLDNLSPFIKITAVVPIWPDPDSAITWNRFEIPATVINISEMTIDGPRTNCILHCFDPDYVFLQELSLKINSYVQRGIGLKLEVEYGWSVPDSIKRQYPKVGFTETIQLSGLVVKLTDTKNGLKGEIKGGINPLVIPVARNYSPSSILGIGSVANYFLIYDFLCLDLTDKLELIWTVKDAKVKQEFIMQYLQFVSLYSGFREDKPKPIAYDQIIESAQLNPETHAKGLSYNTLKVLDSLSKEAVAKAKTAKAAAYILKETIEAIEEKFTSFPSSPYAILTYFKDPENKKNQKVFEKFFVNIDLVMQNYKIHPYRIYKFLVDVFQKDVLGNEQYQKMEQTEFFDIDFVDFSKDGMGGNIDAIIPAKKFGARFGDKPVSYLEAINILHSEKYGENYKSSLKDDSKFLVKETYKRIKIKNSAGDKKYGSYFFPVSAYSISTQTTFENMIPDVAKKCRKQDNTVIKGKTQQTDDSNYACQFFRATPLSAFQNLGVLELILKSRLKEGQTSNDLLDRVRTQRAKMAQILTENNVNSTTNKGAIFCLFVHNKLTAILSDANTVKNNILTSYSFRTRTVNNQDFFNAGTELFTQVNYPDVIGMELEYQEPAQASVDTPYITEGSDYKIVLALSKDSQIKNNISTVIAGCKELRNAKTEIDQIKLQVKEAAVGDKNAVNELKKAYDRYNVLLYGIDGKSGLKEVLNKRILDAFLKQQKNKQVIDDLVNGSKFKTIFNNLSSENIISKKEDDKKKSEDKEKKVKPKKLTIEQELEQKFETAQGDYNAIDEFVTKYNTLTANSSLFPKFNLSFNDPVIFGAGSSPATEGVAANKQMENFRRLRALSASSTVVTLTVFGNPELKLWFGKGAAASIFLNIYNPDGTLSDLAGEYAFVEAPITKFSAGVYTNTLKLRKSEAKNDLILGYIRNNDIVSVC